MKQLKPCPFCGNNDLFIDNFHIGTEAHVPEETAGDYYSIQCENCNLTLGSLKANESVETLCKRWCTRPIEDKLEHHRDGLLKGANILAGNDV